MLILVTGGARSGKSRIARDRLVKLAPEPPWTFVATCEPLDDEMRARVARHQGERGPGWLTEEAFQSPIRVFSTAAFHARDGAGAPAGAGNVRAILLDCLTLWLSNRMLAGASDDELLAEAGALAAAARDFGGPAVFVTNEVGAGLVPESALGRRFRDLAGWVNQRMAEAADEVLLVACGLPLRLK